MVRSPKFLFPVGVVLALGLFILAAPRTVHAVAAALVQITNTASNPAVTQDIGQAASQMVYLSCTTVYSGALSCQQYVAGGSEGQGFYYFSVPANRYLVITAADVHSYNTYGTAPCSNPVNISLQTQIGDTTAGRTGWSVSANAPTTHFTYPPGFALAPGTTILGNAEPIGCSAELDLYGYLTAY